MAEQVFKRTRIAPTPSGFLHVGNVLSFVLTASLASKHGAKILLRIDDLDQQRANPAYVQDIFDTLNFLEIPWHEGPRNITEYQHEWSQLHRMDNYRQALHQLQNNDSVFACTCSRSQIRNISTDESYPSTCLNEHLSLKTPDASWRLKTDSETILTINNLTGNYVQTTLPASVQHFVVRKKDGFPAYQLASVIDDLLFDVDLIVRGLDLWASTLAQLYLATVMPQPGFLNTTFYHHNLVMGPSGVKLSKSAGDTSIRHLRHQGKTAAEIYTEIARLCGYMHPAFDWQELAQMLG